MNAGALAWLYPIFFVSGAAALIFEALWFHQAGLTFGNSVWASALVLSSFMAGLGLGNGLAALFGRRVRRPVVLYAWLELLVAGVGFALVFGLPRVAPWVTAVIGPFSGSGWSLAPARFGVAFLLLAAPAVAMGATLPILIKALSPGRARFGSLLGRLYGINTLGAVAGAASAELVWIPLFGILGSGLFAAGILCGAAALAFALGRGVRFDGSAASPESAGSGAGVASALLLAASFLSGAILLGLEVLWFRLLGMFVPPTTQAFALMLAVVLAGIGLGGLLGAALLRLRADAAQAAPLVALLGGVSAIASYRLFPLLAERIPLEPLQILLLCAKLMLLTSLCSGVFFALLGELLQRHFGSDVRTAGLLTLANTLGSMLGPLLAGFVLLPLIGLDGGVFWLSLAYGAAALCVAAGSGWGLRLPHPRAHAAAALLFVAAVVGFPHGQARAVYAREFARHFPANEVAIAVREESHQIIGYLRGDFLGEPHYHRLATDTYSMSFTALYSRRYMSLFSLLPLAFHPAPRDAVLISFGVGITAKSLTDQAGLERIDVVDISRGILEMSGIVYADDENPLHDPRVHVHVEDGRHFLQTTQRRYDLITGEPPPPSAAGVVNLYTREYFELMRARLREGGVVSYWLPVIQLLPSESKAITRSFCDAFPDCSLWEGSKGDWILIGTRDAGTVLREADLRRPFDDARLGPSLREVGIERPEQLAALFLADARTLAEWVGDTPPLVDDWPHRAPRWRFVPHLHSEYLALGDAAPGRFARSGWLVARWPREFRDASLPFFEYQALGRDALLAGFNGVSAPIGTVHRVLTRTDLETLPLWLLGSEWDKQRIAEDLARRGRGGSQVDYQRALGAIARRDFEGAARLLEPVRGGAAQPHRTAYRLYALCMAGMCDVAQQELRAGKIAGETTPTGFWPFMQETFGLGPQAPVAGLPASRP